jgi:hypothetical protein
MPVEEERIPALDFFLDGLSQHQENFTKPSSISGMSDAIEQWMRSIPENALSLDNRDEMIAKLTRECLSLQDVYINGKTGDLLPVLKLYDYCRHQNLELIIATLTTKNITVKQHHLQRTQKALQKQKKQSAIQMGGLLLIPCFMILCEHILLPMIPFGWAQNIVSGIQHFIQPAAWNSADHIMLILALSAILILPCLFKLAARIDQIDVDLKSIKDTLRAIGRSIPLNEHRPAASAQTGPASVGTRAPQPAQSEGSTAVLDPDTEGAANTTDGFQARHCFSTVSNN